uniref:Cytochrome P450 n=1 Tax=Scoparia dulcis TaxID=107240 RepID=A0A1W7HBR0_SCODU
MDPLVITALLLVPSLIFLIINSLKSSKTSKTYENLPPSPPGLPIIGNLHQLLGALSHRALTNLAKKCGPVMYLKLGSVPVVIISSREAAKEVLKIQDPAFCGRPESITSKIMWYNYIDIAFSPYNDYWKQMRKICMMEMLSAKNVRSFASIREDELSRLMNGLRDASGRAVDLTERVFWFTSSVTSRAAFGKVSRDRDTLIAILKRAVELAGGFLIADFFPSFKLLHYLSWNRYQLIRMRNKLDKILDSIVEDHKLKQSGEYGSEDIVDVLLRMAQNKELEFPINKENIKAIIYDMFSAGVETSSTVIDWTMAELMRNPRVMAKVQAEMREAFKDKGTIQESDVQSLKYLKCVIKESFRLHIPVALVPRACREEGHVVEGYNIPLNSKVLVNAWAIGRDPKIWDEPETFRPERFENSPIDYLGNHFELLPFGAGRRICPGVVFGMANVDYPLAKLLFHFDWKLPEGKGVDMTEKDGLTIARKNGLLLVPTPYKP